MEELTLTASDPSGIVERKILQSPTRGSRRSRGTLARLERRCEKVVQRERSVTPAGLDFLLGAARRARALGGGRLISRAEIGVRT